jgi:cell division transport system ATP-binding protein
MVTFDSVGLILNNTRVLDNVSFSVRKGEFVCLEGPSGAGKSSILKLVHLDLVPTVGTVTVMDADTRKVPKSKRPYFRRMIGFIFQDYRLLLEKTAFENVAFALEVTGARGKAIRHRVLQALHTVGMSHRAGHYPTELSGGECQRVAIARAIVHEPSILLADEPTGNLDTDNSLAIVDILDHITRSGTIVLMATHKEEFVAGNSRVLRIAGGRLLA